MNRRHLFTFLFTSLSFLSHAQSEGRLLSEADLRDAIMVDARFFEFEVNRLARALERKYQKPIAKLEFKRTSTYVDEHVLPIIAYARYFDMIVTLRDGKNQICKVITGSMGKPTEGISPHFSIYKCEILDETFGSPYPYPFAWRMKSSGLAYHWD